MAVLNDFDGALVPRNGANGVNGANGTHLTHTPHTLPVSIPAKTLVDPKTVSTLAQAFNLNSIVNKHSLHKREVRDAKDEKVDVRSEEYMTNILNLKLSQDDKYIGYMNYRSKIANHLQAVLVDSDELLQSLAELTENLSVAQYEKELANEGRKAAEKVRDQLQEELSVSNCELTRGRLRMIEVLRERDDEAFKAQVAQNHLAIRDRQIEALGEDVTRLQKVVASLTKKHGEAVDAFRKAQQAERLAIQDADQKYAALQRLRKEKEALEITMSELEKNLSELRMEHAKVTGKLTDATTLIEKYRGENVQLEAAWKLAKESAENAEKAQTRLEALKAEADIERQQAVEAERKAREERDDAEAACRAAEVSEREKTRMYEDVQVKLDDTKYNLDKEIREKVVLKEQRDHAIKRATVACHYTQESIEWGQALNLINHQLFQQYEIMQAQKIKACEDKLSEARQKKALLGETLHVKQKTLELETEKEQLLEEQRLTRADIDTLRSEYDNSQAELRIKLAGTEAEIATLRVEQFGWDGERSQLKTTNENIISQNTELEEKLKAAQLAQEKLKEAHAATMKERDETEKVLREKFEADRQKREEAEKALRDKIVTEVLEHQDKEKELREKFQLDLQRLHGEEKALQDRVDAGIREREAERKALQDRIDTEIHQREEEKKAHEQRLLELEKKAQEQRLQELEKHKFGRKHDNIWIKEIFIGSHRQDEDKENIKRLYSEIGTHFKEQVDLPLVEFFSKEKKETVTFVYSIGKGKPSQIMVSTVEKGLRFSNR